MQKPLIITLSCLFIWTTGALAESNLIDIPEAELLDSYLKDQQSNTASYEPVATTDKTPVQGSQDLEVIELESVDEEIVEIEAPVSQQVVRTDTGIMPAAAYCRQNPLTKECLYSDYLSLCRKDPQSINCKSQLEKFENFCDTSPRAYKCKKAQMAATCKQHPDTNECKPFSERYCQKHPKAVFCNWN